MENFVNSFLSFQEFGANLSKAVYKKIKEECTEYCIKNGGASREAIDLMCQTIIHVLIGVHADMTGQDFSVLIGDMLKMESEAMKLEDSFNG